MAHQQTLQPPVESSEFQHPYQPYEIQEKFMRDLYCSIEEGKIAFFESPTGTV